MKPFLIILLHAAMSISLIGKEQTSDFSILNYGAVGDGKHLCTEAIQKAIDDCNQSGGGRVVFPPGCYLSGGIVLKDKVELHLSIGSKLLGSVRHEDYQTFRPEYRSHKDINGFHALIYAEKAENIAITGKGTIDGQGKLQKPRRGKGFVSDRDGRPRNLLFVSCRKILIEGITMRNSGVWNQHYLNCEDVKVDKIQVYNHSNRNNDGIDIDGCRNFILSNSIIDSDDDGICLKSTGLAACEYITITNCIVSSHCNAIKTGTESTGGFKNITISNCVVRPSNSKEKVVFGRAEGISGITIGCVDGGVCENVNVSDIVIKGTQVPLFIRLGKRNRSHTAGAKVTDDSVMKNINISNITASGCGDWGCGILGLPGNPISNLRLSNMTFSFSGGGTEEDGLREIPEKHGSYPQPTSWGKLPAYGVFIRNANHVQMDNINLQTIKLDARVPLYFENIQGLEVSRVMTGATNPSPTIIRKNVE